MAEKKTKIFIGEGPKAAKRTGKFFIAALILLSILAVAGFIWSFYNYQLAQDKIAVLTKQAVTTEMTPEEVAALLAKVGKHIILPGDEAPVIASVLDAEALASDQEFFVGSQNGDKVIVYSKRAIIYRPDSDILVNVGPVYPENKDSATAAATDITVEIRNGAGVAGRAEELKKLVESKEGFQVVKVGNSKKQDYGQTVMINLTAKEIAALEQVVGVSAITGLPPGEDPSVADVLVIVGKK